MTETSGIQDKLALLKKSYLDQLPVKLREIEQVTVSISDQDEANVKTSVEALKALSHKLVGSGATFGFPEISLAARAIESECYSLLEQRDISGIQKFDFSVALIDGLRNAVDQAMAEGEGARKEVNQNELPGQANGGEQSVSRAVILLGCSKDGIARFESELSGFGFDVLAVDSGTEFSTVNLDPAPAGVVFDLDSMSGIADNEPSTLNAIRAVLDQKKISCPLIVISQNNDVYYRLIALRAKATSFLTKPVLATDLVDAIDVQSLEDHEENYRILIVDDDESTATYTKIILGGAGMIVETENNPMNIMNRLDDFSPELILMDLYMPGCNGHELASVIRQQEVFSGIPIVFLSSEDDVEKQLGAMEYGGDDFLTKPIRPAHLISAVRARSQRFRKLRSRMIRDSMTGLLNHTTTQEFLKNEISRAEREKTTLVVASIDIDHFKSVNDTYGHAVGDIVIKSLSRLLKQRLRSVDIIGRMGGEEFAAILVGASIEKASEIMNEIRETFANIVQIGDDKQFSVTLSCGVADFPTFATQAELLEASDKALYEAKHGGRNKVVIAQS